MAVKSEEVFIALRAIGAAKTRRDIDSVADALGRLNNAQGTSIDNSTEISKAVNREGKEHRTNSKSIDGATDSVVRHNKATKDLLLTSNKAMPKIIFDAQKTFKVIDMLNKQEIAGRKKLALEQDKIARDIERITLRGNRIIKSANADIMKGHSAVARSNRAVRASYTDMAKTVEKESNRMVRSTTKARKGMNFGRVSSLNHPFMFLGTASAVFAFLDAIPFVGTGLNAIAAGAIAAVNGLAPLTGLLGLIPGGLAAFGQAGLVAKFIASDLGKALDGDADALARLGPVTKSFVGELNKLKAPYQGLRKSVQESFFRGLDDEIDRVGNTLLPIFNRNLNTTADLLNLAAKNFGGWLTSTQGKNTLDSLMGNNSYIIGRGADALQRFAQSFLMIAQYAGPTLKLIADDIVDISIRSNNWISGNEKRISNFFLSSYSLAKDVLTVVGNFGRGIFNIFRQASPLSDALGQSFMEASENFLAWTEDPANVKKISDYFAEMKPNLYAIADLAGALAKGIFDISRSPKFVEIVKLLQDEAIPALVELFKQSDGKFIPSFIHLLESIAQMAESGALDILADILSTAAEAVGTIAGIYTGLPDGLKKSITWGVVMLAFFGGLVGSIGKLFLGPGGLFPMLATQFGAKGMVGKAASTKGGMFGLAGRGVLGAAGVAAGAYAVGSIVAPYLAPQQTDINQDQAMKAISSGDINAFFNSSNGKGVVDQHSLFGLGTARGVNGLDSAISRLFLKNGYETATDPLDKFGKKIFGTPTDIDNIKDSFSKLDQQLSSSNPKEAAAAFKEIADAFAKQKISIQDMNALFPTYLGNLNQVNNRPAGTPAGPYLDPTTGQFRFAGGMTYPGSTYLTGELGPELAIGANGSFGMVGLNGPEVYSPSSATAIIPSSATTNPFGGNYGNAPEWAKNMLQGAYDNVPTVQAGPPQNRLGSYSDSSSGDFPNVVVNVGTITSDVDLKGAVKEGIQEWERERRERK